MATVSERLRKRRCYPLPIGDETLHVRAMTFAEIEVMESIGGNKVSEGYVIGKCLVEPDGTPCFEQGKDEKNEDFGKRVLVDSEMPTDTAAELLEMVMKLTKPPTREEAKKN